MEPSITAELEAAERVVMRWDSTTSAASSGGGDEQVMLLYGLVTARRRSGSSGRWTTSVAWRRRRRRAAPMPPCRSRWRASRMEAAAASATAPCRASVRSTHSTTHQRKHWPREVLPGHLTPPPHLATNNLPLELLDCLAPAPRAGEADCRSSPADSSCTMQQRGWDSLERCGRSGGDGSSYAQWGRQQLRAAPMEKGLRALSTIHQSSAT